MDVVKFDIGQTVYMKVSPETAGMVTGILFRPSGILYYVVWPEKGEDSHFDIELTAEKTFTASGGDLDV